MKEVGASHVTVIADREGDIYEDFAFRPESVDMLVRAGQDRRLMNGEKLFAFGDQLAEQGRMIVELPSTSSRKAHEMTVSIGFSSVEIARPSHRASVKELRALPAYIRLTLINVREVEAPQNSNPAHWRLLTSHEVKDIADAKRIIGFYKQRWTIEQLFRTMKSKGFEVESIRIGDDQPFEKLVICVLIAAIRVMQLVHARDGKGEQPLEDAFSLDDIPLLKKINEQLEGKTAKQKNPYPITHLAYASWVFARLGGWTGYYGKPGPIVIYRGLIEYNAIRFGWDIKDV